MSTVCHMSSLLTTVVVSVCLSMPASAIDLSHATIVSGSSSAVVAKAGVMLQEELAERSGIALKIADQAPTDGVVIRLGTVADLPGVDVPSQAEAYGIEVSGNVVNLVGFDERGTLYAAGRLIRLATCKPGTLILDLPQPIATAPDVPIRAHQLGYRHTANTYDAWTVDVYEQYIRDLIMFGCNGIELISSLDPEEKDGPVMTERIRDMNVALAWHTGTKTSQTRKVSPEHLSCVDLSFPTIRPSTMSLFQAETTVTRLLNLSCTFSSRCLLS